MDYIISDKMKNLKPSAIREIFKYAADPAVISFAGGNPAPESLPVDDLRRFMSKTLEENPVQALLYSQSEGHPPLRAEVRRFIKDAYDIGGDKDELMIVSGAQQCMDLVTRCLCNEGDTVICEDPSFIGSLNCFRSYNVSLKGVPIEDDGINLALLEKAITESRNVRFMYLIPNFQNPTGITMSIQKRKAVLALSKKYSVPIVEDNPYGDLRFIGEDIPSIKSMDEDGLVIYAGSFSKILSTGIRCGYLLAPAQIFPSLVVAKQCADVHTGMLQQLLCLAFLQNGDLLGHARMNKFVYADKCGLMLKLMDESFPKSVTYTRPNGGLFIWATMPDAFDGAEFALRLVRDYKVCVVPGSTFSVNEGERSSSFRLNFSMPNEAQVKTGIEACAKLLREMGVS